MSQYIKLKIHQNTYKVNIYKLHMQIKSLYMQINCANKPNQKPIPCFIDQRMATPRPQNLRWRVGGDFTLKVGGLSWQTRLIGQLNNEDWRRLIGLPW